MEEVRFRKTRRENLIIGEEGALLSARRGCCKFSRRGDYVMALDGNDATQEANRAKSESKSAQEGTTNTKRFDDLGLWIERSEPKVKVEIAGATKV